MISCMPLLCNEVELIAFRGRVVIPLADVGETEEDKWYVGVNISREFMIVGIPFKASLISLKQCMVS